MVTKDKGRLIGNILSELKFQAFNEKKQFDYGDTFLSLAFMDDKQLKNIARLCGVKEALNA